MWYNFKFNLQLKSNKLVTHEGVFAQHKFSRFPDYIRKHIPLLTIVVDPTCAHHYQTPRCRCNSGKNLAVTFL